VKRAGCNRGAVRISGYAPVGGRRSPRKDFGVCTTWAPAARKGRLDHIAVAALVGDARRRARRQPWVLVARTRDLEESGGWVAGMVDGVRSR